MSKRDIKAKRWYKRAFKKRFGLSWMLWYYAERAMDGKNIPARVLERLNVQMFIGGRSVLPPHTQREINRRAVMALNAITGNAGDGAGVNGNMREVETLPLPERSTSKPYSGANYTENIE